MQKVSIFPYFSPRTAKNGRESAFSGQTYKLFKLLYYQNDSYDSNQILHSDKDHQILVVAWPKICPTNPKWQTATILKKG